MIHGRGIVTSWLPSSPVIEATRVSLVLVRLSCQPTDFTSSASCLAITDSFSQPLWLVTASRQWTSKSFTGGLLYVCRGLLLTVCRSPFAASARPWLQAPHHGRRRPAPGRHHPWSG